VQTIAIGHNRLANMTVMILNADRAVPITDEAQNIDLRERIGAAAATLDLLTAVGYEFDVSDDDIAAANDLAKSFAKDPVITSKAATHKRASALAPATIALVKTILDEFGHEIAESSKAIRNLVINKLIIESENPDARIRIRAIEMLGKMSDIALFTERSEVLITHQSTDDLKSKLKEKLQKLRESSLTLVPNKEGIYEAIEFNDVPQIQSSEFHVDDAMEELGIEEYIK
jgi:hypothetical protein